MLSSSIIKDAAIVAANAEKIAAVVKAEADKAAAVLSANIGKSKAEVDAAKARQAIAAVPVPGASCLLMKNTATATDSHCGGRLTWLRV